MLTFKNMGRFTRNLQLTLILLIPSIVAFILYVHAQKEIDRVNSERYDSYVLADELRQTSDDLTRFARTYVLTLDPQYKRAYRDVIDIRNGLKPRPEAYNRIYWDLVAGDGKAPRPNSSLSIPLLELMRKNGFSAAEMAKLTEAKNNSDRLVALEREAMRLAESTGPRGDAERAAARLMLHDRRYHQDKARIMKPIDDFYAMVDRRTASAITKAGNWARFLRYLFICATGGLLFMLWRTYRAVYETLGGTPDEVSFHIARMGQSDFSSAIPVDRSPGPSVMKSLAETQSKLAEAERERLRTGKLQGQILAIVESSNDAIISKTIDGIITSWNPAAERLFGYSEREMLGQSMAVLIPPERWDEERQILAKISGGEIIEHFETYRRRKDGEMVAVSVSISPIRDASGAIIGASKIARDISARKQAEAYRRMGQDILLALNDMESKEAAIQQAIRLVKSATGVDAVGIRLQCEDDYPYFYQEGFAPEFVRKENSVLARTREGGICRDCDGNICLECTCGLVISGKIDPSHPLFTERGSSWTNDSFPFLDVPADEDPRDNPRNECIHQGYASVALIPIKAKGVVVGLLQLNDRRKDRFSVERIHILEDIAENIGEAMLRKQAEEELRKSKDLVLSLLQSTDQGIYGIDRAGNCIFINNSALDMLGHRLDDCLGKNMHVLIHHQRSDGTPYPEEECPVFQRNFPREGCRMDDEVFWRSDGSSFPVEYSAYALIEHEEVTGAVVSFADISSRMEAAAEKRELESQLYQAQKMESIGSLAGGIAHDFNNKLSVILGCTYLAEMEGDPVRLQAMLQEIRMAAEQSADLTRQLLAFARKQVITPRALDLNLVISGMLKMLTRLIGENIRLDWQSNGDLWPVKLDPSQVDQLLANLCVNARDSIVENGRVTIQVDNRSIDGSYCVSHLDAMAGDYVRIAVSDNGCGMRREVQARIFEPFFTTKAQGTGTGLGLATVFGIVKQNGGFINVYSEPGLGSTFSLYFPRYCGGLAADGDDTAVKEAPFGKETVLLVEDDAAILSVVGKTLEMQGYLVLSAGNFDQAMMLASQNSQRIRLLITDVVMPEVNGRELCDAVNAVCPEVRCLFMSGYTEDIIGNHGVLEPGVHFIQKPFSLPDLATKVRSILDA
ncbi:PAS domain S-box protein [Geomonas sp. Red32]|uniref:PAS domain S-box protein n=1 Tax=Geomonas sp. Red32 TaxID=2912856 RepID=UPI00202CDDEC|nr:PAS domain S-box protein [Geomonas sp. Red32]MCM0083869.1 PAS domain S-box protein [Geomonas sp. Red32]